MNPKLDQPDKFQGLHNRVEVRWVVLDLPRQLLHPCISLDELEYARGSYCTRVWGPKRLDLRKLTSLPRKYRRWVTVGDLLDHPGFTRGQVELSWCPDCLLLAKLEAELRAQPQYPVSRLCKQLARGGCSHQPGTAL